MAHLAVVAGGRKGRTEISLLNVGLSVSSVSDATVSVMLVFALRTFQYLSDRFGINLKAYLKAAVSSLHGSYGFFWAGLPTECLEHQKKFRARASNQIRAMRM